MSVSSTIRRKTSQLIDTVRNGRSGFANRELPEKLAELVIAYENSSTARRILAEFEAVRSANSPASALASGNSLTTGEVSAPSNGTISDSGSRVSMVEMRDVVGETGLLRGRRSASWATQFRILSGRAFKNLYRDPALLTAHYLGSIALALICGLFFHNVGNDIAGFQNRLGIFFFTLALFGFSCLSSLGLFANERILFMRERANGYYSTFTYFSSKVLFDILPLRLVPPLLFGGIVYGLVGLVATVPAFWKFILTLVLFNLTTASVILLLSIAFESTSLASLVGTLVMLFNLLFTGLLINRETVTPVLQWLHTVSFFHAAFEALAVNELRYLQLKEIRYGVELDVPAATILSIFGLRAQSFWWPNISLLGIFFVTFTVASFLTLHLFVKEKR
jgi:ABC-type multidrug transport system permease subunit